MEQAGGIPCDARSCSRVFNTKRPVEFCGTICIGIKPKRPPHRRPFTCEGFSAAKKEEDRRTEGKDAHQHAGKSECHSKCAEACEQKVKDHAPRRKSGRRFHFHISLGRFDRHNCQPKYDNPGRVCGLRGDGVEFSPCRPFPSLLNLHYHENIRMIEASLCAGLCHTRRVTGGSSQ